MISLPQPSPAIQSALRAGIAVSLAIAVTQYFHLSLGYWLILSTIVVLQPTFGATLQRSKARALGTILGVAMGALLAALIKQAVLPTAILGFMLVLSCVISMRIAQAYSIFFATTLVMLLLSYNHPNHWEFVTIRVYDTIIGAGIGIGCSLLLWPSLAQNELKQHLIKTLSHTRQLHDLIIDAVLTHKPNQLQINPLKLKIESNIDKNRDFLNQSSHELFTTAKQRAPTFALLDNLDKMHMVMRTLHFISTSDFKPTHPRRFKNNLYAFKQNIDSALAYAKDVLTDEEISQDRELRQQILKNIELLPELPQDRSTALRFLHLHLNLLLIEANHIVHAALLACKQQ